MRYKFEFILITLVLILFVILQPKLSVYLFYPKRTTMLNGFNKDIKTTQKIDAKKFWQFREFYYPGYIKIDKSGFKYPKYLQQLKTLGVKMVDNTAPRVFLIYNSDKLSSVEAIVEKDQLKDLVIDLKSSSESTLIDNKTEYVAKFHDKIYVYFVKPVPEMLTANGYYDYKNPHDRVIIEGKYWLNISAININ